jgi:transposase
MMERSIKIEKEIKELDEWIKTNPDSRELKRGLAVKMSLQGWLYTSISSILNVSTSFISKWKKIFNQQGITGLKLSYKGSQSYLTKQEKEEVIIWLQQQEYWDLSELECYLIEQYDVVFKAHASYYNLLKEAKISWQKAQAKNPRQDPDLVKKKNKKIAEMLTSVLPDIKAENTIAYAIDEVHLLEGDLISHLWGDTKNRLKIPLANPKNRQTYYGALELFDSQLYVEEYPSGNGIYTVDFLKKLIGKNPHKKIIIFWDGVSYHRGEEMQNFLAEINQNLEPKEWKITCEKFAPYAPEENPIEAIWLSLKNLLRRCYRFCKNFRIIKQIFKLLIDLKLFKFPNLQTYDAFSCLI